MALSWRRTCLSVLYSICCILPSTIAVPLVLCASWYFTPSFVRNSLPWILEIQSLCMTISTPAADLPNVMVLLPISFRQILWICPASSKKVNSYFAVILFFSYTNKNLFSPFPRETSVPVPTSQVLRLGIIFSSVDGLYLLSTFTIPSAERFVTEKYLPPPE